jgi:hypothetical protein
MRTRSDSPTKTCTNDGCSNALRAKGLCATHYNQQHQPNRHRKVAMQCALCSSAVMKEPSRPRRYKQVFCDEACHTLWRLEYDPDHMAAAHAAVRAKARNAKPKPLIAPYSRIYVRECRHCQGAFTARSAAAAYCSNTCRNRARRLSRGKRHNIRRIEIFERDNYLCWICGTVCHPTLQLPDRMAATVDHLQPRSFGGTDEPDNLATAHMVCNSRRGASWSWPTLAA